MADAEQLRDLGQQLAAILVASYGGKTPGAKLVFLPGGVSVPTDLVQAGMVNPTQMQTWLSINFDSPFAIAPGGGSVLEKDSSHGSISQLYTIAATSAQPLGHQGDAAWTRVDGEIAAAQRSLGQPDAIRTMVCEPDDWPLPTANAGYWTKFDSSVTQSNSTESTVSVPVVRPEYWMVRSLAPSVAPVAPPPSATPGPIAPPSSQDVPIRRSFVATQALESVTAERSPMMRMAMPVAEVAAKPLFAAVATAAETGPSVEHAAAVPLARDTTPHLQLQLANWRTGAAAGAIAEKVDARVLFQNFQPVQTVTTSTDSTIKIHLEHQCVALGYYSAGQPWLNSAFLSDQGWYVPGMARGGLLPPAEGGGDATFGLPIGLVIVQNLQVSGQWSSEAAEVLSSPGGTIGPLSLFGATATKEANGVTVTYAHDGMQVVALFCNALPVLPPADAPAPAPAPAAISPAPSPAPPSPDAPSAVPSPSEPPVPSPSPT